MDHLPSPRSAMNVTEMTLEDLRREWVWCQSYERPGDVRYTLVEKELRLRNYVLR